MPSKQSARTRTRTHSHEHHHQQQRTRAWGTRFDSLNSSPPPAQSSSPAPSPPTSPTPGRSSAQLAHALSLELFGASATPTEKRDWADDDVPSTLFSPGRAPLVLDVAGGTPGRKDTKLPHNASVFIGSLPPDTDEAEMAQLLAQHLEQFANVQNIKIIHDSKGGLCAFAQCENATQAAQLVSQAQANPQSFMGRYLRYENARAHRTLWISYRTPMHFMPCASQDEEGADVVVNDNSVKGRWIESDLPDALRIWKPRDARFPIITYRGEAHNIGDASRFDKDASTSDVAPAFRHKGELFTDLKFDAQTIKKMAEAFGPLESFKPYLTGHTFKEEASARPADHDAGRSPGMDLGVWEVKWGHRDDCITALNTLRCIPHLTVTWAKDYANPQTPRHGFLRTPTSPRYPDSYSPREAISPIARGRPFLLLDCTSENDGGFRSADSPSSASTFARSPSALSPQRRSMRPIPSLTRRRNEAAQRIPEGEETDDGWTVVRPQNITRAIMSSLSGSASESPIITEDDEEKCPEWSERDFPPLKTPRGASVEMVKMIESKKELASSSASISLNDPAPSSPAIGQKTTLVPEGVTSGEASLVGNTPNLPRPLIIHRRSLSNPVARLSAEDPRASPGTQTLEIPPTPELANTSLTPTPTSAQPDPATPMYSTMVSLTASDFTGQQQQKPVVQGQGSDRAPSESGHNAGAGTATGVGAGRREHQRQATVDPKTIFVGGLEPVGPRPWDEPRLREIFEKYGEVQNVRIVNPMSKKTGFAFVTFAEEQSTLKAIREEHNRFYDGRQIRVQIRDMFPPRGGFKFRGRGLGRRPFGFDPHFVGIGHHPNIGMPGEQNSLELSRTGQSFGHQLAHIIGAQGNTSFRGNPHIPQQLVPSISTETGSSTLRSSTSFDAKPEVDALQESDSNTALSVSPSPSALSASASTSAAIAPITPQSMPPAQVGYYPQHAWATPYGTQMHYSMPYSAYGGMMPTVPMQFAPVGQGVDPNTAAGNTSMHWGSMYRAAVPFAPYPYMIMPPTSTEAPRSATATSQPPTPVKGQPPLHATGFIQREHGVLFPVYQPEALSEYMSGSSPTQNTAQFCASTTGSGPTTTGQQQQSFVAAQMWHGYPHAPQFIAYPVPQASTTGMPSCATPPASVQQQAIHQQIHGQPLQPSNQGTGSYVSPGLVAAAHPHSAQQHVAAFSGPGASAAGMPPLYFAGVHPTVGAPPPMTPRGGPQVGHATHGATPGRPNSYMNKHPPRRDPGFHHSRNGQGNGHGPGSSFGGARSPSTVRPASGSTNTPCADQQQTNNAYQQRQRHAHAQVPPLQLGFNKHNPDGGHSQQHQWMTNFQQ